MTIIFVTDKVDRVVFHFNKAHNQDQTIPQWIVKHKGKTYYVNHLVSSVGFTTKNSPDSDHTKGALQFRGTLRIIDTDGESTAEIK